MWMTVCAGEGLSPEERARAEDAQADVCYLLESDIEVSTIAWSIRAYFLGALNKVAEW